MVSSSAGSIKQYLAELDEPRRGEIKQLLELIRSKIKPGYVESMSWGMICFEVPLEVSGVTYNKQPLVAVGLASQKQHISIYLTSIYAKEELAAEFKKRWVNSGKKLDMGKGCVRFRTLEQADLKTIAWAVSKQTPRQFSKDYLAIRDSKTIR